MNIEQIRELESRTFRINKDLENWKVVIDRKLQYTRLHFTEIANDMVIKVLSRYLIKNVKYSGIYICVFKQNKNDDKKFLVKFNIDIKTNTVLILRLKRNIDKSYNFNKAKNFYFDTNIYLEEIVKTAVELKVQNKKANLPVKNREINTSGLRIVKKKKD